MLKIVKEKNHAFLKRIFQFRGKHYMSIAVLQLFSFTDREKKYPEKEVWQLNNKALNTGETELFDYGFSKKKAEFLAVGYAYTYEEEINKTYARISFAGKEKTLAVFGNRTWTEATIAAKMSEPEIFSKIPLTNTQAFGGKSYTYNPKGKGIDMIPAKKEEDDVQQSFPKQTLDDPAFPSKIKPESSQPKPLTYPLPNTESPDDLILNRGDRPKPATFYPMAQNNLERIKKFGTFDQKWLKKNWPHFADDLNWQYFNSAWPDQQYDHYFTGNETFTIENMHPEKKQINSELPGWRLRAFNERQDPEQQSRYEEMPLQLDTVWFVPEKEQGVLVWHGQIEVTDAKASDVTYLHFADESLLQEQLPIQHYADILKQEKAKPTLEQRAQGIKKEKHADLNDMLKKLTKETGRVKKSLQKSTASFEAHVAKREKSINELMQKVQSKVSAPLDRARQVANEKKAKEIDDANKMLTPSGIAAAIKKAKIGNAREQLAEHFKKNGLDILNDPKEAAQNPALVKEKVLQHIANKSKMLGGDLKKLKEMVGKANKHAKSPNIAAAKLRAQAIQVNDPEERAKLETAADILAINKAHSTISNKKMTREHVEQALKIGQCLRGEDLSDLDLSRLNFAGLDVTKVDFSGSNLSHANLNQANLSGANLHGTDLSYANAEQAIFLAALLLGARFSNAHCQQADFTACKFQNNIANHVDFSHANFSHCQVLEGEWENANFAHSKMTKMVFMHTHFAHNDFSNVNFKETSFYNATLDSLLFNEIQAEKINFIECDLNTLQWEHADITAARFANCTLKDNAFTHANCGQLSLSHCKIYRSKFVECTMAKVTFATCSGNDLAFSHCNLNNSRIGKKSDFIDVTVEHSDLTNACWLDAKLPGADFYRCQLNNSLFSQTQLENGQFRYCDMQDSRLQEANLQSVTFKWCNLQSAMLREANIMYAQFLHCNLYGVDFYHAVSKETVMQHSVLSSPLPPIFEEQFIHG